MNTQHKPIMGMPLGASNPYFTKSVIWFLAFALVVTFFILVAPEVQANPSVGSASGPRSVTKEILMDRIAIEAGGGGIDMLASNTTGGLNTTLLKVLYSAAYAGGTLFVFTGIVGWRNQYKQDETQRKFLYPGASIVLGVALAGFTTVFGLMSDTMGFGAAIDDGVSEEMNLSKPRTGIGIGDKTNSRW